MTRRSLLASIHFHAAAACLSLAIAAGCSALSAARAADVTLAGLTVKLANGSVVFSQVIVEGGNLSREELTRLFMDGPSQEIDDLAKRLQATRIRIPETTFSETASKLSFHGFEANGISQGTIARVSVAGLDGSVDVPGAGAVKSQLTARPFQAEKANFVAFLHGVRTGNFANLLTHASHVKWEGFDLTAPDPSVKTSDNITRFHLGSLEITSSFAEDIPKTTDFEVKNAVFLPPKGSPAAAAIATFGLEKLEFSFRLKGNYDLPAKVFTIEDYSLVVAEAGAVSVQARVGNVDKAFYGTDQSQRQAAFENASLAQGTLRYADGGLFNRIVTSAAERTKTTPQALKNEWITKLPQFATGLLGDNVSANKLAVAVAAFINTPATLTLSASDAAPVKFGEFKRTMLPGVLARVTIDAVASK